MGFLNITGVGGTYIRFNASTEQWLINSKPVQLTEMMIDHTTVKTGWGLITEGSPPVWQWDLKLGEVMAQPNKEYRRGFSVQVWVEGYDWLEWGSTAAGSTIGFDAAFESIWNERHSHPDQYAVLKYQGSTPIRVGKGSTRQPLFQVTGWMPKALTPSSSPTNPMPVGMNLPFKN
jgi:hypothetical protein